MAARMGSAEYIRTLEIPSFMHAASSWELSRLVDRVGVTHFEVDHPGWQPCWRTLHCGHQMVFLRLHGGLEERTRVLAVFAHDSDT